MVMRNDMYDQFVGIYKLRGYSMDKPLSQDDIEAMESQLRQSVEADRQYWRVNDVKCDAIYTAGTYEEFADRVAAAHLRPLERADYKEKKPRVWNPYATKEKQIE